MQRLSRIPSLDGLRALSVLAVMLGHTLRPFEFYQPNRITELVINLAPLGVTVFFCISGFVITSLLVGEQEQTGTISLRAFYTRRVLRIFPAFYVYWAVTAIVALVSGHGLSRHDALSSALFLVDYSPIDAWRLGHIWSLSVEEHFYLLWPPLVYLAGWRRSRLLCALAIGIAPFLRDMTYVFMPASRPMIAGMFHTRLDMLAFGCMAALLRNSPAFMEVLNTAWKFKLHLFGLAFIVLVDPVLSSRYLFFRLLIGPTIMGAFLVVIIMWTVHNVSTVAFRLLNTRCATHIGTISYSIYLWQQMFLPNGRDGVGIAASVLLVIACAEGSYWIVERPFLLLRQKVSATTANRLAAKAASA